MRRKVLLFAALADRAGCRELEVEVSEPASVAGLLAALARSYPELATLLPSCRVAVNRSFAPPGSLIPPSAEIAIIPPVSGGCAGSGAGETGALSSLFQVTSEPLSPEAVMAKVVHPTTGAAVLFCGTVREFTGGRRTVSLAYEAYEAMAMEQMAAIGREVAERWPGARAAISHRVGELGIGETSVVIAVATPHRADAFAACRHAIERLKETVPIWKKENWQDGSEWVGTQTDPA